MPSIALRQTLKYVTFGTYYSIMLLDSASLSDLIAAPKCWFLYKHSTSGPPEGLWRPAIPWRPSAPQPPGGTEVGCKMGLGRLASTEPTHFIPRASGVPQNVMLDWTWPHAANSMSPLCCHQWHRLGFQPSATGWLSEALLFCANPLRASGGPRGVNRWPAWPP